ncbi:hypothetical protein L6R46_13760 [Myxococcota bacterium]|jgi:hypothetical protein|nr:hypothetical protein [Myxococcota bacterium]
MRNAALLSASTLLISALTGCGFAAGSFVGSLLTGDELSYFDIADSSGMWSGSGVVCLGGDESLVSEDGLYTIRGRFIRDEAAPADFNDNLIPCADEPARVATIRDDAGNTFRLGYAWRDSGGWDITPWVNVFEDEQVSLVVRQGDSEGTTSAGFGLTNSRGGLVYALEANRGEPGLAANDIPGLSYRVGEVVGTAQSDECGERSSFTLEFVADGQTITMFEGEDLAMEITDELMTVCTIASYELSGDCADPVQSSWVMFR